MGLGTTALRATIGPLFVGHGAQKLFGSFGGHGLEGTGGYFESLGLRPGKRHATAAGAAELAGGALLTLGALTPVGASLVSGTMITAIRKAHAKNGPWATEGGYEYNLALAAAALALADIGPGPVSLDRALGTEVKGPLIALAALAAGLAGPRVLQRLAPSEPAQAPAPRTDAPQAAAQETVGSSQ